jgi:hypothetical protein
VQEDFRRRTGGIHERGGHSYYAIVSLFPLLLLLISIVGFLLQIDSAEKIVASMAVSRTAKELIRSPDRAPVVVLGRLVLVKGRRSIDSLREVRRTPE